jgi:(1->4)-alpha-D-glucan 1-alpha-D-glucosylmutase
MDRRVIETAVRRARRRNRVLGRAVYDFIRDTLLLRDPPTGPATDDYRAIQKRFVGKFQQLTPPVTAKGSEDTAFYVYNRLVSLNEVGGEPDRFGHSPGDVHQFLATRTDRFPLSLSPLSTHDTKRGEDVRARLNVLSEIPAAWGEHVLKWRDLNRPHKTEFDGDNAPNANDEYLIYQTLVGTLSPGTSPDKGYVTRIVEYMHKAVQEAKVHSSWINYEPEYHAAAGRFVEAILDQARSGEFLADLNDFVGPVARAGTVNSLAQTLIRCTAPGVPDTYQGTELWDWNLVDPDNRRPVDFRHRAELLREVETAKPCDLLQHGADGRVKLFVVCRALRVRRQYPELFSLGSYVPLTVTGKDKDSVFAFLRTHGDLSAVTVVPRLTARRNSPPDAVVRLPTNTSWKNVFTGESLPSSEAIPVRHLFAPFPLALLMSA